jgi:predicted metal-dependent hydrolase
LSRKREWIREKRALAIKRREAHKPREFVSGEELPYLGGSLMLAFTGGRRVERLGGILALPKAESGDAERLIAQWYAARAREFIGARVQAYAERTGIRPSSVSVTGARRRWGSCSAQGRLNFAWRLIMAPPDVIDYVVVHELAHIEHHNHSKAFWARVGEIMPDYQAKRKWLKDNGALLGLF